MEQLAQTIEKNGFIYNQIVRSDNVALYEQVADIDGELKVIGHELFKIKVMKEGLVFGDWMPEREVMPKNEDFGVSAWSILGDQDAAIAKYANLVTTGYKDGKARS